MNGNPNSKQWGPWGKFWWGFVFIPGVLYYTGALKWVLGFGAASIVVLGLYAMVTRGGKGKSAAREDETLDATMRQWERQGR